MEQLNSNMHSQLSESIIERLRHKKILTVIDFIIEDQDKLRAATNLSFKEVIDIKKTLTNKFGGIIKRPSTLWKLEQLNTVRTRIRSLDDLLGGGLNPGQIYEVCGLSFSGKTQLCLTIASNIALFSNSLVRYIDTKGDFFASRVDNILRYRTKSKEEINKAMEQIKITLVRDYNKLLVILQCMINILKQESDIRTRALIIDSLPGVIFKSSKEPEMNFILNRLSNLCRFIANEFNIPIIIVNLITYWTQPNDKSSGSSTKETQTLINPTLGKYWLHIPNTRLLIEKLNDNYRRISVWKSFQIKMDSICNVKLNDAGVT
ncbi:PREDICTED: DNA repair protein RAD51 homolog 4-like [Polistes dominula]|uniref:DNA repair protein RAD51 homolog 4-like n=1 Tax=Polistes dominula TaxID=743375 RepID=A0ABM1I1S3_POLDO|nr:PREDICTED: DNA repair protein RAD51 homolog 4-like [Polistes dominula]XP_015174160.1 PREDICTED: DNA repair protein RAD51 homolog 4-like [Polistes dominula]XP_015174161.1 PREDICTED: DNA repair protein RAD51 homolog 4-like [Polistes dominula]